MAVFGSLGTPNRVFSPRMSTSGHLYAPRGTRRQLGDTPASFAVRITLLSMQNRVFAPRKLGTVKTRICMVMTLGMPVSMAECHWATPRGIREAWEISTGRRNRSKVAWLVIRRRIWSSTSHPYPGATEFWGIQRELAEQPSWESF